MHIDSVGEDTLYADFGFAEAQLPPGTHVCQIYDDDIERTDAFVRFLMKGMELRELCAGFSDDVTRQEVEHHLHGASLDDSIQLQRTSDAYFSDHTFDPDGMLDRLTGFHHQAYSSGFAGARVIGEMAPAIKEMDGANRLLEYEARVNILLRDKPMVVMCQYNARAFDGATLMDVLKAHALMVVRGTIVHNPYYLPPEELLGA
jgi:hypothetical protein